MYKCIYVYILSSWFSHFTFTEEVLYTLVPFVSPSVSASVSASVSNPFFSELARGFSLNFVRF